MANKVRDQIDEMMEDFCDLLILAGADDLIEKEDMLLDNLGIGSAEIDNVVFNPPATIIFWSDGTKTVVKTQNGEHFDKEKGLAMAICKKISGNCGAYYDVFKEWCRDEETEHEQE